MKELSGVDDPAHGTPGWLVMKSRSGEDFLPVDEDSVLDMDLSDAPEDVQEAYELFKSYVETVSDEVDGGGSLRERFADRLRSVITKNSDRKDEVDVDRNELVALLAEREERIIKAVEEHIASSLEDVAKASETADPAADETQVASLESSLDATQEALVKALDRIENLEKAATSSAQVPATGTEYKNESGETVQKSALRVAFERAAAGERVTLGGGGE